MMIALFAIAIISYTTYYGVDNDVAVDISSETRISDSNLKSDL